MAQVTVEEERTALAAIIDNATMFPSEDIERAVEAVIRAGFHRAAAQREPTDAQVEAALKASKRFVGRPQRDVMRAALRAAQLAHPISTEDILGTEA